MNRAAMKCLISLAYLGLSVPRTVVSTPLTASFLTGPPLTKSPLTDPLVNDSLAIQVTENPIPSYFSSCFLASAREPLEFTHPQDLYWLITSRIRDLAMMDFLDILNPQPIRRTSIPGVTIGVQPYSGTPHQAGIEMWALQKCLTGMINDYSKIVAARCGYYFEQGSPLYPGGRMIGTLIFIKTAMGVEDAGNGNQADNTNEQSCLRNDPSLPAISPSSSPAAVAPSQIQLSLESADD